MGRVLVDSREYKGRTIGMSMCYEHGIYPTKTVFRKPLYGGLLEALSDINDDGPDGNLLEDSHRENGQMNLTNFFSPSLPRMRITTEVFR